MSNTPISRPTWSSSAWCDIDSGELAEFLRDRGIRITRSDRIRLVTHLDISESDNSTGCGRVQGVPGALKINLAALGSGRRCVDAERKLLQKQAGITGPHHGLTQYG